MCCLRRRNWLNVKLHVREFVQSIALALNVPSLPVLQDNYINGLYQYLQDFDCNIFALLVCWGRDGGSWGRGCPSEGTFHCPRTCTITEGGIHSILMIMGRFDKQRKTYIVSPSNLFFQNRTSLAFDGTCIAFISMNEFFYAILIKRICCIQEKIILGF